MFKYRKIFVSPHKRTLMTAVAIFKSYRIEKLKDNYQLQLILLPLAKEILSNSNDLVMTYDELKDFINNLENENPHLKFDFSILE